MAGMAPTHAGHSLQAICRQCTDWRNARFSVASHISQLKSRFCRQLETPPGYLSESNTAVLGHRRPWTHRARRLLLAETIVNGTQGPSQTFAAGKRTQVWIDKSRKTPFLFQPEDLERVQVEHSDGSQKEAMIRIVQSSMPLARPPISAFHVAALGIGGSGHAYVGVNLEFPGLPLHHSVHAEQFMVANASQHGETSLQYVCVSHAPCGHCRQFLSELRNAGDLRICISGDGDERQLSAFLPHRFGPHDLLHKDFPLLMEARDNGLKLLQAHGNGAAASSGRQVIIKVDDQNVLLAAALEAANDSYAPYSNSPSGVAIRTSGGIIYRGSYMECAAYNPSLPPLQAAIIAMIAQGGEVYSDITEVVLVEKSDGAVQFGSTVRMALEKIAPLATLNVYEAGDS